MTPRTWPYGTRIDVMIAEVIRPPSNRYAIVIATHVGTPREATILTSRNDALLRLTHPPVVGQRRAIEFRPGGPTGGHWAIVDEPPAVPS